MKRLYPLFEVGHSYRMLLGFGWVQLPRGERPLVGDQRVSTKRIANKLNKIVENLPPEYRKQPQEQPKI